MPSHEQPDISVPPSTPSQPNDLERWSTLSWAFLAILTLALAISRYISADLPIDFSAYVAAAQTFVMGQNPYSSDLFSAPSFRGYIYIYPPGTLPFLWPLTWISSKPLAALESLIHLGAFGLSLGYLWRYFRLKLPLSIALALIFLWHPFTISFRFGNLATYMFAAFIACVWLAKRPSRQPTTSYWPSSLASPSPLNRCGDSRQARFS